MAFLSSLGDFLVGQDPRKVQLDPRLLEAQRKRGVLSDILEQEATGQAPGPREQAVALSGRRAVQRAGQRAQSTAAGARGFGRVLANLLGQGTAEQSAQAIEGQTAEAVGEARGTDVEAARRNLLSTLSEEERAQFMLEEEQRKRAKPGFLGPALGAAGAAIGAKFGRPEIGAQLGGTLGQALTRRG